MDHLLAMTLAVLGMIGFILWCFYPTAHRVVRVLVSIVAVGWLAVYFLVELCRTQPELWSGRAEMNIVTLLIIAAGLYVMLHHSNKTTNHGSGGGAQSG